MTDDEALLARALEEMKRCETPLEIVWRASSAMQIVALLQLALRHPNVGRTAGRTAVQTAVTFIAHIAAYFRDHQAEAVTEIIRRGSDPAFDVGGRANPAAAPDLTDDDRRLLAGIDNAPTTYDLGTRIRAFHGDADRADRAPREVLYLHIGYLVGALEAVQRRSVH